MIKITITVARYQIQHIRAGYQISEKQGWNHILKRITLTQFTIFLAPLCRTCGEWPVVPKGQGKEGIICSESRGQLVTPPVATTNRPASMEPTQIKQMFCLLYWWWFDWSLATYPRNIMLQSIIIPPRSPPSLYF